VAGERRWRASKIAGIDEVPVIIKELSDAETMQIAMIENLQRENLDPIEEAQGYKYLADTFGMTQNEIAETVGKSRSVIANSLRLLSLPEKVVEMIGNGSLSIGHAKILLSLENQESIQQLAVKTVENNLSVRQLEELIEEFDKKPLKKKSPKKSGYFSEMELSLNEQLGRRVKIKPSADDKGKLVIEFFDKNDLKEIVKKLTEE
jgi:ParB family chromosome partitioning protein